MYKIIAFIGLFFVIPLNGQGLFESANPVADSNNPGPGMLGGFVRSAVYIGKTPVKEIPYFQSIYGEFGLTGNIKFGKFGNAFSDVRLRYGNEFEQNVSTIELREAYADLYGGPISIRIGKQVVDWGATSFVNPSNQFAPVNPTVRSPDPDDLKIGAWAVKAKVAISAGSAFEILWKPVYQPSVLVTDLFTFPDFVGFSDPDWPAPEIRNSSYGFLYDLRSSLLDGSLSYYIGFRNTPKFSLNSATFNPVTFAPELIQMYQEPYRIHSAGLNLSVPVSNYILRTEVSWMKSADEPGEGTYLPQDEVSYVGEVEQSGANVTLIAGYYGKYILSFVAPSAEPAGLTGSFPDITSLLPAGEPVTPGMIDGIIASQVDAFNRLYDYQLHEYYHSAYAAVTVQLLNDVLELELPGMYNFTSGELMLRPAIRYSITDGIKVTAGLTFMKGEENSLYNLAGPILNAGFISVKAVF